MDKKYLKVVFEGDNSKKRTVTVKQIQKECTDEQLISLSTFIDEFLQETKIQSLKIEETILA